MMGCQPNFSCTASARAFLISCDAPECSRPAAGGEESVDDVWGGGAGVWGEYPRRKTQEQSASGY